MVLLAQIVVRVLELEFVDHLLEQEFRVADILHLDPAHHLPDDDLQVLVVDVNSLEPVDLLDFIHQVLLQLFFPQDGQDVVGIARAVHERFAGDDALALLDIDMHPARDKIFPFFPVVGRHENLSLTFGDLSVTHRSVDLGDDGGFFRTARLEQLHDPRQPAGDIFRLRGFAGNLGQHISGVQLLSVPHHQVGVGGNEVFFEPLVVGAANLNPGLLFLVGGVGHHPLRQTGNFVHLFLQGDPLLQIVEADHASHFGQDREGVRVPLKNDLVGRNRLPVLDAKLGAVDNLVAFFLASLLIDDGHDAVAVHGHQVAEVVADRGDGNKLGKAIGLGILGGLFGNPRGGAANMKSAHRQLRTGLADRLRRDHSHRFAAFDKTAGR